MFLFYIYWETWNSNFKLVFNISQLRLGWFIFVWRHQDAGRDTDGLVVWDYHVILIKKENTGTLVYDLDTRLPFPCDFKLYTDKSFGDETNILPEFHRMFRVVSGEEFLQSFSSDRRHMRDAEGRWQKPPPNWVFIRGSKQEEHNLDTFIRMDQQGPGTVNNLEQFKNIFSWVFRRFYVQFR